MIFLNLDFEKQMKYPFVIYCDFETLNIDVSTFAPNPNKSSTTTTKHLDVSSYFYKRLCAVPQFTKETVIYRGPDSSMYFIQSLLKEAEEIQEILKHIVPLEMTEDDESSIGCHSLYYWRACLCQCNALFYTRVVQ